MGLIRYRAADRAVMADPSIRRTGLQSDGRPSLTLRGGRAMISALRPSGAVAQLGARVNGIHEVTGSIPVSSTTRVAAARGWPLSGSGRSRMAVALG